MLFDYQELLSGCNIFVFILFLLFQLLQEKGALPMKPSYPNE